MNLVKQLEDKGSKLVEYEKENEKLKKANKEVEITLKESEEAKEKLVNTNKSIIKVITNIHNINN